MVESKSKAIFVFTITALSHPDHILTSALKAYSDVNGENRTFYHDPTQQMNILDIFYDTSTTKQKISLIQPLGVQLIDKMPSRHYKTIDGLIIFFINELKGSFQAARTFYRILRKENLDQTVPVAFVEISEENTILVDSEPELSDETPSVAYFTISKDNINSFQSVIDYITYQYTLKTD